MSSYSSCCKSFLPAAGETHKFSVHSFRIFLACALRDAGKTNAEIREALRWATDDALILYTRANLLADAEMRAGAARANVESVRVPTVLSSASRASEELRRLGSAVVGASEKSMAIDELPASVPNQVISNSIEVTTTAATRTFMLSTHKRSFRRLTTIFESFLRSAWDWRI